ncbi:hypothetical protein ACNTMW_20805 [Planosporangium sp. 12N6]|uniref:hypothetical protein n=1 Tax=Planosporangium spinosum TaxID=3402278 RepID=UPI003CF321FF
MRESRDERYAAIVVAAIALVAIVGFWAVSSSITKPDAASASHPAIAEVAGLATADPGASRLHILPVPRGPSPGSTLSAQYPPASPSPGTHAPVADLSQSQMDNAVAIVEVGRQMKLPRQAFVVAIATALQESDLHILANPAVPASMGRPHQGVDNDHDSVGLFQQRPNWGRVDQRMDPRESARLFYTALIEVPDWEQMAVTVAAQTIQMSAFPEAYGKHQSRAERIVDAIL